MPDNPVYLVNLQPVCTEKNLGKIAATKLPVNSAPSWSLTQPLYTHKLMSFPLNSYVAYKAKGKYIPLPYQSKLSQESEFETEGN